jgi:hypothetical protein
VYDIQELLSQGHFPRIQNYYCYEPLHTADKITPNSASALVSEAETNHTSARLKSGLEVMDLRLMKVDMRLVKRMLEVPSSLRVLYLMYTERDAKVKFSLAEFGDAMQLQSSSLRRIILHFPSCVIPPNSSWVVDFDGGFVAENMCIGSFQDFKALTYLSIPFDAIFGPDPRTSTSLTQLLPVNIEELSLERCMFRTSDGGQTWAIDQVQEALDGGLYELVETCPSLWRLGIACLPRKAFLTLRRAWKNRRFSRNLKEKSKSWKQSSNVESRPDVASSLLDYEGSDWEGSE